MPKDLSFAGRENSKIRLLLEKRKEKGSSKGVRKRFKVGIIRAISYIIGKGACNLCFKTVCRNALHAHSNDTFLFLFIGTCIV
jgi:hypothetical protein